MNFGLAAVGGSTDEPGAEAAAEPNQEERFFGVIFAIEKKQKQKHEERGTIGGDVRGVSVEKWAADDSDEADRGAGANAESVQLHADHAVEEVNDENDADEDSADLRRFAD